MFTLCVFKKYTKTSTFLLVWATTQNEVTV